MIRENWYDSLSAGFCHGFLWIVFLAQWNEKGQWIYNLYRELWKDCVKVNLKKVNDEYNSRRICLTVREFISRSSSVSGIWSISKIVSFSRLSFFLGGGLFFFCFFFFFFLLIKFLLSQFILAFFFLSSFLFYCLCFSSFCVCVCVCVCVCFLFLFLVLFFSHPSIFSAQRFQNVLPMSSILI